MISTHIFDLDKTIWDCYDKHGNSIWAKQLIPPFNLSTSEVVDDVQSVCRLRPGFKGYLDSLVSLDSMIGYCSVGKIFNLPYEYQPSIILLDLFQLNCFSPTLSFLGYKTDSKVQHLLDVGHCIFYDDDPKHHRAVSHYPSIKVVDSSLIHDWSLFKLNP